MLKKGSNVLSPKDKSIYEIWRQLNSAYLLWIVGICHQTISSPKTIDKPFAVKGRNIGLIASRNYHDTDPRIQICQESYTVSNICTTPFLIRDINRINFSNLIHVHAKMC